MMATAGFNDTINGQGVMSRQRGMTVIGLLMAAITIGFVALMVMQVVPMYLNDQKVAAIFKALENERGTERQLRGTIERYLDINMVNHVTAQDFKFEQTGRGTRVSLDYEARARIAGNLAIVATFSHQVDVPR